MTRAWWQSLEDRNEEPKTVARRRREFAEPLPGEPEELVQLGKPGADGSGTADASRRDFLKALGFSAGALTLAACRQPVRQAVPMVEQVPEMTPGEALAYATTCGGCEAGCGLLAKNRDGRVLKVEGLPGEPGGTCAVGQASVLELYDERRHRGPRWYGRQVSWSEIDRQVSRRLAAVSAAGAGIALITAPWTGPATRAVVEGFLRRFPSTRPVAYQPLSHLALVRAYGELLGGEPARGALPRHHFDRARAVVGLDADFLGTWLSPVVHARGWARRRRPGPEMSWHGQFESRLSPTGAVADQRTPVAPSQLGDVAVALWRRLQRRAAKEGSPLPPSARGPSEEPDATLDPAFDQAVVRAADALWHHRGESLVVSGSGDPDLQRLVTGMNLLLGNVGATVEIAPAPPGTTGDERQLVALIEAMERGEIHALVAAGEVDPAWDHPLAGRFRETLEGVPLVVSCAGRPGVLSERAHALCPAPHFLEAWGDAEPTPGRPRLRQPAMAPLWNTREAPASLLAWTEPKATADAQHPAADTAPDDPSAPWRRYLAEHWRQRVLPTSTLTPGDPASRWHRALHDGGVTLSAGSEVGATLAAPTDLARRMEQAAKALELRSREARRRDGWEVVLYPKTALRDGRSATNPWLQEMPDPVSRVTWGNYAALAPADARELGLATGDVVRLTVDGTTIEIPALVQPGQAAGSVAVAVGYGLPVPRPVLEDASGLEDRAGEPVGVDAWPLVGVEEGRFVYARGGARLEATGRHRSLAATQDHHLLEGRDIVRETSLAAWREDPAADNPRPEHLPSLWPERSTSGHEWGLSIDLNACTGCGACVVACQAENNVPVVGPEEVRRSREMHWIRIDRYYRGSEDDPETVFQPMLCQHCDHAPCETVCPVLATVHSSDGLNQQIYNRCIGTRYCANNCPYKVRRFNWFNYTDPGKFDNAATGELTAMVLNPDVMVRSRGVMEKCSMCIQRIQRGKLDARDQDRPLADGDILTACQQACPTDAFEFGDLANPGSRVAERFADPRHYHVLEELGVRPSVGYLTRVRHRRGEGAPERTDPHSPTAPHQGTEEA